MSAVPFHYVDLRAFSYATEDDERVAAALRTLMPDEAAIERQETEGHHGDQIVVMSTRLERSDGVRHVLSTLAGIEDFEGLLAELDDRVDDDCAFFLQLDKQEAFNGRVALGDGLLVRGKVEAYPADRERAVETAETALRDLQAGTLGP